jgi:Fe-S-cluster containining protein
MSDITKIFECQQCGYCCQGETTVSLDANDVKRMVKHLNMTEEAVSSKYWRITGDVIQMKTVNGHCIFYDNGCTIHAGKPWRCTEWPLHPSILSDKMNFATIKESCPGINRNISYKEFCRKLLKLMQNYNAE